MNGYRFHIGFVIVLVMLFISSPAFADGMVGSLEFQVGALDGLDVDGEEADALSTLGITPAFEFKVGDVVAIGGEWMFMWGGSEEIDERRLIMSPHVRVRMSFPVYDGVTLDALLAGGMTMWTEDDATAGPLGDFRIGWSLRFAFGGSYAINETVVVFGSLGYYTTTSDGDDVEATLDCMLFSVGIRARF